MNELMCNFKFVTFNSNLRIQMNLCGSKRGLKIGMHTYIYLRIERERERDNIAFFLMKIFVPYELKRVL